MRKPALVTCETPSTHLLVPYQAKRIRKNRAKSIRSDYSKPRAGKICCFCHRTIAAKPISVQPCVSYNSNQPTFASKNGLCSNCCDRKRMRNAAYCSRCATEINKAAAAGKSRKPVRDVNGLTPAERTVLQLMFVCDTDSAVAKRMGIAKCTAKQHRINAMKKNGFKSQFQFGIWAERVGYGRQA